MSNTPTQTALRRNARAEKKLQPQVASSHGRCIMGAQAEWRTLQDRHLHATASVMHKGSACNKARASPYEAAFTAWHRITQESGCPIRAPAWLANHQPQPCCITAVQASAQRRLDTPLPRRLDCARVRVLINNASRLIGGMHGVGAAADFHTWWATLSSRLA